MDFSWPAELVALGHEAEAVGRAAAAGRPVHEDSWVVGLDPEFSRELGRRGWLGMTWPRSEGGHGRSALERFVVTEALIATGAPLGRTWIGDRQIGPTLLAYGSDEQRRRLLPDLVAGRVSWSLGLSEPDAGSDLASVRTAARRVGGRWVIDGRKVWTSGAAQAEWCYLVARTDPDAPAHAGLSDFALDLSLPGIEIRPIRDMTGDHHFCEITFDGVELADDALIGQLNGSWRQVMRQLEHERAGIDRLVSNRSLFELARARADGTSPLVRQELARLWSGYRVGRLLVLQGIVGTTRPGFSAATKAFCTELEQQVAEFAGRVLGPEALLAGRLSRALCYAPAYTIQGGTSEILRTIIGERALGLPR